MVVFIPAGVPGDRSRRLQAKHHPGRALSRFRNVGFAESRRSERRLQPYKVETLFRKEVVRRRKKGRYRQIAIEMEFNGLFSAGYGGLLVVVRGDRGSFGLYRKT